MASREISLGQEGHANISVELSLFRQLGIHGGLDARYPLLGSTGLGFCPAQDLLAPERYLGRITPIEGAQCLLCPVARQAVIVANSEREGDHTLDVGGNVLKRLLAAVRRGIEGAGAIVVSDYGKGVVSAPVMDLIRRVASGEHIPILVDPKEGHFSLYRGAFVITPNKKEAGGFYNRRIRTEEELERVGTALLGDLEAENVLVTRGEEGMTLFRRGGGTRHFPTRASEVYDVTGAGDTVISVLAAALAAGASIYQAIELANAAAGIVVRELGTAAVTAEDLIEDFPL